MIFCVFFTVMKRLITVLIFSVLYQSCIKDRTLKPVPVSSIVKYEDTVRPQIIIGEILAGCRLISPTMLEQRIDTFLPGSAFTIYQLSPAFPNYNAVRLYFATNLPVYRILSAKWIIGNESAIRNGSSVAVDFENPFGELNAKLIINWRYKNDMQSYNDTLSKHFNIKADTELFGNYYGSNSDDTSLKYTVTIGKMIDSSSGTPFSMWGIQNLMIGYPFKLEVFPRTTGFGLCGGADYKYIVQIGDEKYTAPYAIGYLNNTKDSILIEYSYNHVNSTTNQFDSTYKKKFVGIRN
jgi:hypothetical protein